DDLPAQLLVACQALAHRGQHRRICPHLRMAAHARVSWRYSGEGRGLNGRMAVTAIDAQPGDVMLMAERHLLRPWHILICGIWRAVHRINNAPKAKEAEKSAH